MNWGIKMSKLTDALDVVENTLSPLRECRSELIDLLCVFRALTDYAVRNCCLHESTHRGGILWEICDNCGAKWADDEGGMPPEAREHPKEIQEALDILERFGS